MHDDELDISTALVHRLIARDMPQLRDRPVRRLSASGSSNALFRLGADHLVRLPLRPGGGQSIENEARWVAGLAPALPVSVPEVLAVGRPGFGYPERWSVARWISGKSPATPEPTGRAANDLAHKLAEFLTALHDIDVPAEAAFDRALRSYRAGPLCDVDADIRRYLRECRSLASLPLDLDSCLNRPRRVRRLRTLEGLGSC